jgi:tagatose 1,6-diphosphate aldolase
MNKIERIKRLLNDDGIVSAMAIDQRGSLKKMLGAALGREASDSDAQIFKEKVVEILSPYASGVLLDPEYGLGAIEKKSEKAGVLLAYEKSGYDVTTPGRMPDLLPDWSVSKLLEAGADAVKLLVYYDPEDAPEVNSRKHDFIRKVGEECAINEAPFFLEIVCYCERYGDEKGLEFAKHKPRLVGMYMREFSKPEYCVDVLKVEFPINIQYLQGSSVARDGEFAYLRAEAIEFVRSAAAMTDLPFIYLSAGVSIDAFVETLALAREAGVNYNGVLCGRATWQNGVAAYGRGVEALQQWLEDEGVRNITRVNEELRLGAKPIVF